MFQNKCHLCGTFGKKWEGEKGIFHCPNCFSVYSNFGVIIDSKKGDNLSFLN